MLLDIWATFASNFVLKSFQKMPNLVTLVVVVAAVKLKKRKSCICPSSLLSPTDLKRDMAGGRLDESNIGTPKWSPFYSHRNWMVDMQIGR